MENSGTGQSVTKDSENPYLVAAILRACSVLHAFRFDSEILSLSQVTERTGLHKATTFRTIQSLVVGGLLEKVTRDQYRRQFRLEPSRQVRIGYAAMTEASVFSRDVTDGIRRAAAEHNIDLVECDNRYSARVAIRNAGMLAREKADLVIEVQIHEEVAPQIAAIFSAADIPVIAVDIPQPGAVFFGGNNYEAGRIGGRALGQWAKQHWNGNVDAVILLGLSAAGVVPAARTTGFASGFCEVIHTADSGVLHRLDGKGGYVESMEVVRRFLSSSRAERILVGAQNDASALGAMRVIEESGRSEFLAVVGQNATAAARAELRRPATHLIGSVAFFPEKYGGELIKLALRMIQGRPVPPYVFVDHALITPGNVDEYYPNDALLTVPDADTLLWNFYH